MGKIICFTKRGGTMCTELIKKIRASEYTIDNMPEIAEQVLNQLNIHTIPVPIVGIMQDMNFGIYRQELDITFSGYIMINKELKKKLGQERVVCVNELDNVGHQRFTIAHELAHYLFDYDEEVSEEYFNTYKTNDDSNTISEQRANKFAANLLMPKNQFIDEYNEVKNMHGNLLAILADRFKVSSKAIERRLEELELV